MWKKIAIGAASVVLLAVVGMALYIGPSNIIGMIRYDIREEGAFKAGDIAPDVDLLTLDGELVSLTSKFGTRPTVLIFGSFT